MLKKLKKAFICSLGALSFVLAGTSCSMFGGQEEGVMIKSITAKSNENNDTELTITFTDSDIEPVTFLIPKGEEGEKGETGKAGVGIKEIINKQSDDGKHTIIVIRYTDEEIPDTEILVKNGVSVVDINSALNVDNNSTVISFILSDGSEKTVEVPNGKDGKDGVGIDHVETSQDAEKNFIVTIYYTGDLEPSVVTLPYKNGEDGRGIESTVGIQDGNYYTITINYNDGTSDTLAPIEIPTSTKWMYGYGKPTAFEKNSANEGDYYFDFEGYVIYVFVGGEFNAVIDLTENHASSETVKVTFNKNGGKFVGNYLETIDVIYGRPIAYERIPVCEKEGLTFMGWYTKPNGIDLVNSGKLTDLTPIYGDTTFYAQYK